MQNGNRKGIAQWSKTYAGKKFYTSILFLALPIILLVTFTFIPALDMVIFSFQNIHSAGTGFAAGVYPLLKDKSKGTFQGNTFLPLSYERRCGIYHIPKIFPQRSKGSYP